MRVIFLFHHVGRKSVPISTPIDASFGEIGLFARREIILNLHEIVRFENPVTSWNRMRLGWKNGLVYTRTVSSKGVRFSSFSFEQIDFCPFCNVDECYTSWHKVKFERTIIYLRVSHEFEFELLSNEITLPVLWNGILFEDVNQN